MGKRKRTQKSGNSFDKKEKMSRGSRSFWNNAGQFPTPAVNIDRPFDFDVGFPNDGSRGFGPFLTGSAQYVTTTMKIPDDWCNCAAFDLAIERLYQSIRENLRSNLSYTSRDLKAYIASVTWVQAICSAINRDFAFLNYRDAQHPSFEHIWGRYAYGTVRNGMVMTKLTKGVAGYKQYLNYQDIATSLTYIDNVVVPKLKLLVVPPASSEFCRWLMDAIYVDEINSSRAQWYWNEVESIPIYKYAKLNQSDTDPTFFVSGHMSTFDMSLETLVEYATDIASTFGVIIADLRRCGAQMVSPYIATSSERQCIMKYDDTFFYALRNAYTSGWDSDLNGLNPEFFLVDFYEGMTNDQMCNALSLAGGISSNSELVKPIVVSYQSVLVETDHTMRLFIDPIQSYPGSSTNISLVSPDDAGIYYMSWETCGTSTDYITTSGSFIKTNNFTSGNDYGLVAGVIEGHGTLNVDPSVAIAGNQFYFLPVMTYFTAPGRIPTNLRTIGFTIPNSTWTRQIQSSGYEKWTANATKAGMVFADGTAIFNNGSTVITAEMHFFKEPSAFGVARWRYDLLLNIGTTSTNMTTSTTGYDAACLGTVIFGKDTGNLVTVQMDPSISTFAWLMQEVDHHIPIRATNVAYDVNSSAFTYETRNLLKETAVSTMYTREELSALLYSLNLSLFMVHANSRSVKQA